MKTIILSILSILLITACSTHIQQEQESIKIKQKKIIVKSKPKLLIKNGINTFLTKRELATLFNSIIKENFLIDKNSKTEIDFQFNKFSYNIENGIHIIEINIYIKFKNKLINKDLYMEKKIKDQKINKDFIIRAIINEIYLNIEYLIKEKHK